MAVTLPIVGNSEGTWGSILNTAITDIDNRLITATDTNGTQDTAITSLGSRVTATETAAGKLIVCTSTTIPPAAVGQMILETDTGYMSIVVDVAGVATRVPWPGSVMCRLRQTTAQNFAPSTSAAITFQVADVNRMSGWSAAAPADFKAPVAGVYEFTGGVSFEGNANGYRRAHWLLGGSFVLGGAAATGPCIGSVPLTTCVVARPVTVTLAKNSVVQLQGAQNSGTGVTLSSDVTNIYQSSMTVKYLGVG